MVPSVFSHGYKHLAWHPFCHLSVRFELQLMQPGPKVGTCKLLYNSSTFNLIVQLVGIASKQIVYEETGVL